MAIFRRLSQMMHSNSNSKQAPSSPTPAANSKSVTIPPTTAAQPTSPTTTLPSPTSTTATAPATPLTPLSPTSPTSAAAAPAAPKSNPFVIDYRPFLKKWLDSTKPALASALDSPLGLDNWFAHQMAYFFRSQIAAFGKTNIQVTMGRQIWAHNDTAVDVLVSDVEGKLGAVGVRVRCEPGVKEGSGLDSKKEWARVLEETVVETKGLGEFKKGFEGAVVYTIGVGKGMLVREGLVERVGEPADQLKMEYTPEPPKGQVQAASVTPVLMEMVAWHWPEFEKTLDH